MFLSIVLCIGVTFIGVLLWMKSKTNGRKKLPGPTPLPILGNLLQIGFRPHATFTKWAKCYGPIYGIKLGFKEAIIVNDVKLITELFNETASTGKQVDDPVMTEITQGPYGVLNSTGSTWEEQRKFTLRILRTFGFAKTSMETMILDEVQIMLEWLKNQESSPILCKRVFTAPVINSLWRIVSSERCQWEKGRPAIVDATDNFFKELMNVSSNGILFAPCLRFIAPNFLGWNRYVNSVNTMLKLFRESVVQHEKTFDSTELRDYIDHQLLEVGKNNDPKSSFYKDTGKANMMAGVTDLFAGGSETTSTALSWATLYLSEHQNVQKTLQKEIDQVLGSTLPSLSNRVNMPYCEATISEILRITPVSPLSPPHTMISDLVFHDYDLPMGATVFANIYAVHHDTKIWGDPETFRPERFLNEDKTKFVRNIAFIPFSEGKRRCIGDTFAMDTLFLFVTSICQNFDILPDPGNKGKADLEPDFGFMLVPKPLKVVFSSRKF